MALSTWLQDDGIEMRLDISLTLRLTGLLCSTGKDQNWVFFHFFFFVNYSRRRPDPSRLLGRAGTFCELEALVRASQSETLGPADQRHARAIGVAMQMAIQKRPCAPSGAEGEPVGELPASHYVTQPEGHRPSAGEPPDLPAHEALFLAIPYPVTRPGPLKRGRSLGNQRTTSGDPARNGAFHPTFRDKLTFRAPPLHGARCAAL